MYFGSLIDNSIFNCEKLLSVYHGHSSHLSQTNHTQCIVVSQSCNLTSSEFYRIHPKDHVICNLKNIQTNLKQHTPVIRSWSKETPLSNFDYHSNSTYLKMIAWRKFSLYSRILILREIFIPRKYFFYCEWNFAKFSSREIVLPRNFPPTKFLSREYKIIIAV